MKYDSIDEKNIQAKGGDEDCPKETNSDNEEMNRVYNEKEQ